MSNDRNVIPHDNTLLPGMKTIMADRSGAFSVQYVPDVEYVTRGEMSLKMQILLPENQESAKLKGTKYPLIVFVQGAAWMDQNCYFQIPMLCEFAKRGYVVASVKHRPAYVAKFPAFLQDVKSAIRYLRKNSQEYCIDPDRVAICGDSSGGHTSLMIGTTGDMEEFKTEDNLDMSDSVSAVVDFYGPTDAAHINDYPRFPEITQDKNNIPEDILFGGVVMEHPEIAQVGNPINYVSEEKDIPPILIMHGDKDGIVPFNQSVLMYNKLTECNKLVEFYKVIGAGHGEYFWTKETIDTALNFIGAFI